MTIKERARQMNYVGKTPQEIFAEFEQMLKDMRRETIESERNAILTICEERLEEIKHTYVSTNNPVDAIEKANRLTEVNYVRSLIAERAKEKA